MLGLKREGIGSLVPSGGCGTSFSPCPIGEFFTLSALHICLDVSLGASVTHSDDLTVPWLLLQRDSFQRRSHPGLQRWGGVVKNAIYLSGGY